jgi:hypothetical protein
MDGYVLRRAKAMLKQVGVAGFAACLLDFEVEPESRSPESA